MGPERLATGVANIENLVNIHHHSEHHYPCSSRNINNELNEVTFWWLCTYVYCVCRYEQDSPGNITDDEDGDDEK